MIEFSRVDRLERAVIARIGGREMNLQELKDAVDSAVERAVENEEQATDIRVSLQIDGPGEDEVVCSNEDVELHYDGNIQASGCVLVAYR